MAAVAFLAAPARADVDALLHRTAENVAGFLVQLSDVRCVEDVLQEKVGKNGRVEEERASRYEYLLLLDSAGGELKVDESRHLLQEDGKGAAPLLVSNGFSMLFLVFHPYYALAFEFSPLADDVVAGRPLRRVAFRHVPGRRSPAVLHLRGREYPLDLQGTAWIDPATGTIVRIAAGVGDSMRDVGLTTLRADVTFAPADFGHEDGSVWFPAEATVEAETPRQHWRNVHRFREYRRFSVSTEERVGGE
jgi:hypothetical protein